MAETAHNPGYKTSEFWVTVVIGIFVYLNESGILGNFKIPTESLGDIVSVAISFILGRLGLKAVSSASKTNADAKVEVAKAQAEGPSAPTTVTVNNTPSA